MHILTALTATLTLLAPLVSTIPTPNERLLHLPQELQGIPIEKLDSCAGGTGFCSGDHCLCSSPCDNICQWYNCGPC